MNNKFHWTDEIKRQWFIFAMFFCILMAVLNPYYGSKDGPFRTEYTVQYGCISFIYFTSGLKQTLDDIKQCFKMRKLFFFIQINCFFIIPMFVKVMTDVLGFFNANVWVIKGLLTLSCSPPPLWSAIAMLRLSKEKESLAVFNTLLANFTGTVFTPIMMIYLCGSTVMASPYKTVIHVTLAAILPLVLGMLVNYKYPNIDFSKLHSVSEKLPLAIIYCSICDCIYETQHMIHDSIFAIGGVLQVELFVVLTFSFTWIMARTLLPSSHVSTALYCSSHKDMVLDVHQMSLLWGWSGAVRCAVTCRAGLPTALMPACLVASYFRVEPEFELPIDLK